MTSGAVGATAIGIYAGVIVYDHWGVAAAVVLGCMIWGAAYAAITFLLILLVEALSGNLRRVAGAAAAGAGSVRPRRGALGQDPSDEA